jgi:TPR repeat protein
MPLIRQSAKAGFSRAQSLLGNCLLMANYGFDLDYALARKWLILAAQKDAEAAYNTSVSFSSNDFGRGPNQEKAFYYAKKSAEMGDVNALNSVGCCHKMEMGTTRDFAKVSFFILITGFPLPQNHCRFR